MKKRFLAVLLAAVMAFSMAACGSSDGGGKETGGDQSQQDGGETKDNTGESKNDTGENKDSAGEDKGAESSGSDTKGAFALDGTWPAETVKIAVETYDVTDAQFLTLQKYCEYLTKSYNIEFMYSESIASAEDELKFIENAAAAGCKAVIGYYNVTEAEAIQLCADKGMYYWGQADNEKIYNTFKDNEYYLGAYDNGEADYNAGKSMAEELIAQGAKKLIYVSGGKDMGVPMFINRAKGFTDAVEAADGVEIVYEVPGWPGTDQFTAAQTEACDKDFDGLACSFTAAPWFQPLTNVGKLDGSVKIATIGVVDDVYKDLADAGIVSCVMYDCEESLFGSAIPLILNSVTGHADAARNADGTAANYEAPRWVVNSPESYDAIYEKHGADDWYVTAEDMAQLLVEYNGEAGYRTFTDLYGSLTLESAVGN